MGALDSYIQIVDGGTSKSGKTRVWHVIEDTGDWPAPSVLGQIKWYGPWRKYVFYPSASTIFEEKCMNQISEFIKDQTDRHMSRGGYRV